MTSLYKETIHCWKTITCVDELHQILETDIDVDNAGSGPTIICRPTKSYICCSYQGSMSSRRRHYNHRNIHVPFWSLPDHIGLHTQIQRGSPKNCSVDWSTYHLLLPQTDHKYAWVSNSWPQLPSLITGGNFPEYSQCAHQSVTMLCIICHSRHRSILQRFQQITDWVHYGIWHHWEYRLPR